MQSRSTNFSILFFHLKFIKNDISSNELCVLKTVFGDRNDFGSFEKRTLGYRLENRLNSQYSASVIDLKIQVTSIDTFFRVCSFYYVLI